MTKTSVKGIIGFGLISLMGIGTAYAETARQERREERQEWRKEHPRRTQVNKRLNNQNRRIAQGVRNGALTPAEAKKLRSEDRAIRQEERDMAKQNGGHITKQEQRTLNQQENAVSGQIYQEKHDGK